MISVRTSIQELTGEYCGTVEVARDFHCDTFACSANLEDRDTIFGKVSFDHWSAEVHVASAANSQILASLYYHIRAQLAPATTA